MTALILGALHWGMEFAEYGGQQGYRRLMLGTAPVIWGWATLALDPTMALIAQWAGFTGMWWTDLKATTAGWGKLNKSLGVCARIEANMWKCVAAPRWYSQYRFYLSILVGTW